MYDWITTTKITIDPDHYISSEVVALDVLKVLGRADFKFLGSILITDDKALGV